uniref:Estradiol 17-beta-dehydrogenase 2-like n=1 Tax=Sinocyclocheilus rhinocerous TaxID=307959 RepID=A0A673H9P5_9TELE
MLSALIYLSIYTHLNLKKKDINFGIYYIYNIYIYIYIYLVFVSGCDSGFGHDLAKFLDSAGMRVFAGVLDELHPGALKLKKDASPNLTVLQLDITNSSQITQAHQYIQSQTGLWALVNNAGVLGYVCDGEILPIKMYKKCLDVNFIGSVEITQAFLPLIRQSKGRLISISSMAGEVPLPGFAGYGASKAALISFNGAIRQELSRWGVKVIIIQPGAFKTSENKDPFTPRTITIMMTITLSSTLNTTTEVPLSKTPNPQLLPGCRSIMAAHGSDTNCKYGTPYLATRHFTFTFFLLATKPQDSFQTLTKMR